MKGCCFLLFLNREEKGMMILQCTRKAGRYFLCWFPGANLFLPSKEVSQSQRESKRNIGQVFFLLFTSRGSWFMQTVYHGWFVNSDSRGENNTTLPNKQSQHSPSPLQLQSAYTADDIHLRFSFVPLKERLLKDIVVHPEIGNCTKLCTHIRYMTSEFALYKKILNCIFQ